MSLKSAYQSFISLFSINEELKNIEKISKDFEEVLRKNYEQVSELSNSCEYAIGLNEAISMATNCFVWSKDSDGRMWVLNDHMKKRLFNLDIDLSWVTDVELVEKYKQSYDYANKTDEKSIIEQCLLDDDEVLEKGKTAGVIIRGRLFGQRRIIRMRKNVIRDENRNVIGIVGIGDDITEKIETIEMAKDSLRTVDDNAYRALAELLDTYAYRV